CHSLHYRHCPWPHAGVVPALALGLCPFALAVYGFLLLHKGGHGLKGHLKINILAIAYAALYAAAVVGLGAAAFLKNIIMLAALHQRAGKPAAVFKTFYGIYGEHCLAKCGVQFIKNRFAQTNRHILNYTVYSPADGISIFANSLYICFHFCGHFGIGTTNGIFFDF